MASIENKDNIPSESSVGDSHSGKKESEEAVLQNVEGSETMTNKEEEDGIYAIRARIETLSVQMTEVENLCRNQPGSGWRIVCSEHAVCDKLRQFNIVLQEIAEEKEIVRKRLQELTEQLRNTQSQLQYCGLSEKGDKKRGLERSNTSQHHSNDMEREVITPGEDADVTVAVTERQENMVQDTITETVQQDEMERPNMPSRAVAIAAAGPAVVENYGDLAPMIQKHKRISSAMKHHDEEERNKLEIELIRVEKEMKYDYFFMKEVADGELKTAIQWLSDLKYQASETEDIINDEIEKLKSGREMITYQECRMQEAQQRLKKWNSSDIDELSKVMQSKGPSKATWPEQSPLVDEGKSSKKVSSIDDNIGSNETPSPNQFPEKTNKSSNKKKLEAQQLAIDLTQENKFPAVVV